MNLTLALIISVVCIVSQILAVLFSKNRVF